MPNPDDKQSKNQQNTNDDATNSAQNTPDDSGANSESTQPSEPQYATLEDFNQMRSALDSLTETLNQVMGGIKSIKDAQGVMVRAGATIVDDNDPEPIDDFKPLSELDFSIRK